MKVEAPPVTVMVEAEGEGPPKKWLLAALLAANGLFSLGLYGFSLEAGKKKR